MGWVILIRITPSLVNHNLSVCLNQCKYKIKTFCKMTNFLKTTTIKWFYLTLNYKINNSKCPQNKLYYRSYFISLFYLFSEKFKGGLQFLINYTSSNSWIATIIISEIRRKFPYILHEIRRLTCSVRCFGKRHCTVSPKDIQISSSIKSSFSDKSFSFCEK